MQLPPAIPVSPLPLASICDLSDLAVLEISGQDAVSFIQSQITNDIAGASYETTRLAGYCTAQGRLLASMIVCHSQAGAENQPALLGLIKKDILTQVQKRLGMFVLRAKAKLTEAPLNVRGICLQTDKIEAFQTALGHRLPTTTWQKMHTATGIWICAPSVEGLRWWCLYSAEQRNERSELFNQCDQETATQWNTRDILAGLPWIVAATQDLFIPQTLNLDLIEGVSFTKGCYPGQEIVARSHYRGTLKRRMFAGSIQALSDDVQPGADIYDANNPDQPCGRIINIAPNINSTHLLFEVTFEAADHQDLHAGSASGPAITELNLPYPIRAVSS